MSRDNADILCQFHEAWVAELDHPGINYWLKAELLKMTEPGEWNQFWLGGKTTVSKKELIKLLSEVVDYLF